MVKLGVIAGSGFENLELTNVPVIKRHGDNHQIAPKRIDHQKNIQKLLNEGCTHVLIVCSAGILGDNYLIGDIIAVKDFIDITPQQSFFDRTPFDVSKHHVGFGQPLDPELTLGIIQEMPELKTDGIIYHWQGNRFQTPSEVTMISQFANLVNMTAAKEIQMAHEAGLKVACVAIGTDYADNPTMQDISKVMDKVRPKIVKIINVADEIVKNIV